MKEMDNMGKYIHEMYTYIRKIYLLMPKKKKK